jgi:hypothetical protein
MTDMQNDPVDHTQQTPKPPHVGHVEKGPAAESHAILRSMMTPDEVILRHATISTGIYWKGCAVLVLGILVMFKAFSVGVLLLCVGLLSLFIAHLTRHFLLLAATNKRVIMRAGIINLDVLQLRYSKIESVELAWTIVGQFLGYASVVITGTGSRVVIIPFIKDAIAFRQAMNEELLKREGNGTDE